MLKVARTVWASVTCDCHMICGIRRKLMTANVAEMLLLVKRLVRSKASRYVLPSMAAFKSGMATCQCQLVSSRTILTSQL